MFVWVVWFLTVQDPSFEAKKDELLGQPTVDAVPAVAAQTEATLIQESQTVVEESQTQSEEVARCDPYPCTTPWFTQARNGEQHIAERVWLSSWSRFVLVEFLLGFGLEGLLL